MTVRTEKQAGGAVMLVTLDNPPINSLSAATRKALHAAIVSALDDDQVVAVEIGRASCRERV